MNIVSVKKSLNASADSVWKIVSRGDGVDRWLPVITTCRLDGTGPGATRTCTTAQGHELVETIVAIDPKHRIFHYRIDRQNMMPTRNLAGTLCVAEDRSGNADVLWFLTYELLDAAAAETVRAGVEHIYEAGLAGLERLARETPR
jgi:uncharacterized protein YndB with AHSA1/START domain